MHEELGEGGGAFLSKRRRKRENKTKTENTDNGVCCSEGSAEPEEDVSRPGLGVREGFQAGRDLVGQAGGVSQVRQGESGVREGELEAAFWGDCTWSVVPHCKAGRRKNGNAFDSNMERFVFLKASPHFLKSA